MIKLQFGSHVYGTNIETSDTDYKGIYLPPISSCVLGNINHSITFNTKHDFNKKNNKSDIDFEIYSLQKYISLLIEGQTVAIDMLFTPKKFYVEFDKKSKLWEVWNEIINNKIRLLPSGTSSFAGYCKTQAAKYGLKGSRIAAVKKTIHLSEQLHQEDKISVHLDKFNMLVGSSDEVEKLLSADGTPLIRFVDISNNKTGLTDKYLEICNRKFSINIKIKQLTEKLKEINEDYGQRARLAENNKNVDWKALMHAVRVCFEAKELLLTANVTFPRPEKELLLKIRRGNLPYKEVASLIEEGLKELDEVKFKSVLPTVADKKYAESLILKAYNL